jgi:hypothetical protein
VLLGVADPSKAERIQPKRDSPADHALRDAPITGYWPQAALYLIALRSAP